MAHFVFVVLSLLLYATTSFAQNGVEFQFPTENLTFYRLDTVNVTWTSGFKTPLLITFCSDADKVVHTQATNSTVPGSGSSLITLTYTNRTKCWFDLKPATNGKGANSPVFTYDNNPRSQTTIGLSPTSTAGSTSVPDTGTTPSGTSTPDGGSSGLSSGAKAGIGVGVAVGVLAILGALGFFFWKRKQHRHVQINQEEVHQPPLDKDKPYDGSQGGVWRPEPGTTDVRSELPGSHGQQDGRQYELHSMSQQIHEAP